METIADFVEDRGNPDHDCSPEGRSGDDIGEPMNIDVHAAERHYECEPHGDHLQIAAPWPCGHKDDHQADGDGCSDYRMTRREREAGDGLERLRRPGRSYAPLRRPTAGS